MAYRPKSSFTGRIIRTLVAVVILTAFVLLISVFVKNLSQFDSKKFAKVSSGLLSKANIDVDEDKVGDVAGKFIERISNTNISATSTMRTDEDTTDDKQLPAVSSATAPSTGATTSAKKVLEVAVFTDIHEDLASLERALYLVKNKNINQVVILGDLTNYGDTKTLREVKGVLDKSGLKYYVIPGDHDLAQSVGSANYLTVFGDDKYVLSLDGVKVLIMDNSANFTPILPENISWFKNEALYVDYIFLSQPLFTDGLNAPFNKMYMGSTINDAVDSQKEGQDKVKTQRDLLLQIVRDSKVKAIIAGDHHKSSKLIDTQRNSLTHYVVGPISKTTEETPLPQKLVQQTPRFSILNVFNDGNYNLEEVTID